MAEKVQLINLSGVVEGQLGKGEAWVIAKQRSILADHPTVLLCLEKQLYYYPQPQATECSPGLPVLPRYLQGQRTHTSPPHRTVPAHGGC